jgi:hypothetical protein
MTDLLGEISPPAREALFSDCRTWRYRLAIRWRPGLESLACVMLNPSTADEIANDPTVERCERRARRLGFGGLIVLNLFAFRATDPADMKAAADPIGPENDAVIRDTLDCRPLRLPPPTVLVGWGAHGHFMGRAGHVFEMLREMGVEPVCLGTTADGQPRHPLYIRNDAALVPWSPSR